MNFCEVFFGVAAGLIVGLAVNLIVNWYINKRRENRIIEYFKYEIDINIEKITSFKEELESYKEKVLADSINTYFGWFYLSEIILNNVNQFFYTGLIYDKFKSEDIEALQKFQKDFSSNSEGFINNQVRQNIIDFQQQQGLNIKEIALSQITFWKNKFNKHIENLQRIKNKL